MARTIAFLAYDFRASGVVRNILRIAAAARGAGLDARRLDFAWMLAGAWLHAIAERAGKLVEEPVSDRRIEQSRPPGGRQTAVMGGLRTLRMTRLERRSASFSPDSRPHQEVIAHNTII